jgi:signal transduction histidine kinase
MENENIEKIDTLREKLIQTVQANRIDLISRYGQSLRGTLFTNRFEMRPSLLKSVASDEADALLNFLCTPEFSGEDHGARSCQTGLSEQTLLGLRQVTRQFFMASLEFDILSPALDILDTYQNAVVEGFIKSREKIILAEQEQIRSAFQIAISRYTVEIKEVQILAQKATEANEFKTRFIARVSHELRTPLGALLGMSEMLQENVYGPLTPAQRDITQRIINNTHVLEQVFTELLDQSKLESGQLRLRLGEFSPKVLAQTVHSNNLPLALQKGLSMQVEIDPDLPDVLIGDKARIEQILSNLVINAIKYTQFGSIAIHVRREGTAQWILQVKDSGIGISEANQAFIFEPFRQVDETVGRKFGGVGLGLSIVQQLVTAMDGKVSVESKIGVGSTFTVVLPLQMDRISTIPHSN